MNKNSVVALVGRMNVGKSTLFNRLSTTVKSITLDYAGVTRDVIKDTISWHDRTFELVDTGGLSWRTSTDSLLTKVREKALAIVDKADVIVFVCDGTIGVTNEDREIARHLHTLSTPVIIAINKGDNKATQEHAYEFATFGYKHQVTLSAEHGTGINDLLDAIIEVLPKATQKEEPKAAYRVMLLGKPNVGKSSLLNLLLHSERSIVSDQPGTTREAISEKISFYQEHLLITDTPGIRRKRSIETGGLESLMVHSSLQALKEADVVLLLIDASEGRLVDQELKLGFYAFQELHKALIIVFNKTDLATPESKESLDIALDLYAHLIRKVPTITISCKDGKNVGKVLPLIKKVWDRHSQTLPDTEINRIVISNLQRKPLMHQQEQLHIHRARQLANAPITIGLGVNEPDWFGQSQLNFFENILRKEYDLLGAPVKFVVRKNIE